MRYSKRSLVKALAGLIAGLGFSGASALAQVNETVNIPPAASIGAPIGATDASLKGEYWKRPVWSIATDGRSNPANRVDTQIASFGPATGFFKATRYSYTGNDLTAITSWLATDGASYSGVNSNFDDGAIRMRGFLNVTAPGTISLGGTSDDGSRITIAGIDVYERDNGHGDETEDADVVFSAAGLYPIEVTYFNGDWTSDGNNHTGNPDPGVHGGANFHLRVGGARVVDTPGSANIFHSTAPKPLVSVGLNFGANDNGAALGLAPAEVAGAVPQTNWNNLNGASGSGAALVDNNGAATTISVEWTSPNTWASTGRGEENNGFPAGADRTLMTGYIDTGNSDATKATVTVSGIPADFSSGGYDVLVYHLGGVGGRSGAYTIGGETKYGTAPASPTAHREDPGAGIADAGTYVRFSGQFGSSFVLTASADPALGAGVNFRAPINGIQIVKSRDPAAGLARGYLQKRRIDNIGNSVDINALLTNPRYLADEADLTCLRSDFSVNDANECNDCGLIVRGLFIPTVSGPHTFYLSADDGATLFLSTDANPANKVRIANEPTWTGRRDYVGEAAGGGRSGVPSPNGGPQANISAPVNLVAGNHYYIEGAVKEAGGGDNLDVAVQGPGDPEVVDGQRPVFGDRIGIFADLTGSSLAISQQPASQVVAEGQTASFTVAANVVSPLCGGVTTYQWQRKGRTAADFANIAGANSANYTTGPLTVNDDNGASYRCVVSIPGISRTSAAGTLEVTGGNLNVAGAQASGALDTIYVSFDGFVSTNDATTDRFNYTVEGPGGAAVTVNTATLGGNGKSVVLATDALAPGTQYKVTVNSAVTGLFGSPLQNTMATLTTGVPDPCGGVMFEAFNTGGGNTVATLTSHPSYPNSPDFRQVIGGFESRLATDPANPTWYNSNAREGYGARMRGLFIPPISGDWVFFLASDDAGELRFNPTGPSAAGAIKIQEELGCCNAYTAHRSAAYPLVAGRGYYLEALYKEGTGGDFLRVHAQIASEPAPAGGTNPDYPGSPYIPGGWLGYPNAPAGIGGGLTITQQPANTTALENSPVTLSIGVTNPNGLPICYQWKRGGVAIPGATGPTYTIPLPTVAADHGAVFSVDVAVIGSQATSTEATLTVVTDNVAPTCVSASSSRSLTNITVTFSEIVSAATAQDRFNYSIAGIEIPADGGLSADGKSVSFGVSPALAVASTYDVVINGVTDLAGNTIAAGSICVIRTPVISCGFAAQELYLNIGNGVLVSDLTSNPVYPNNPSSTSYVGLLEDAGHPRDGTLENFGTRITGFLIPPVSGSYNFYMSSDDGGAFYLSTDSNPANVALIASEPTWNGVRDWVGTARRNAAAPENRSTSLFPGGITLTAGQMYYFEALAKEGGGGNNLAVTWQLPGAPVPANGSSPISGAYMATLADPGAASVTITDQPDNQSVIENTAATFSVAVNATVGGQPATSIFYQWYRMNPGGAWTPISGANSATYAPVVNLGDNGAKFRVAVYVPGATATSDEATLSVCHVNSPPKFTAGPDQTASGSGGQTVPGWATGISPHSIVRTPVTVSYNFSTTPAGSSEINRVLDLPSTTPLVRDGILKLTDAINGSQGGFLSAALPAVIDSFTVDFNLRMGGGTCCGAALPTGDGTSRAADGMSVTIGEVQTPITFPVAAEEGAAVGAGVVVAIDTWDNNGADEAPAVDVKVGGSVIGFQSLAGEREGGRPPAGPLVDDPANPGQPLGFHTGNAFAPVRVHLDSDGTVDVDFKGVRVINNLATGLSTLANPRIAFGGRTGGANNNHWVDDLQISAFPVDSSSSENSQTVAFNVSNNNNALFSVQPAISANGTLTYTPAPGASGSATVTVTAMDNGGTSCPGSDDTSDPVTFTITVPSVCTPPVANADSAATPAGTAVTIAVLANDTGSAPLSVSAVTQGANGAAAIVAGGVSYTPNTGFTGTDTFTYTAANACGTSTATVTVTVGGGGQIAACFKTYSACSGAETNTIISANNQTGAVVLDGTCSTGASQYTWLADLNGDGTQETLGSGAQLTTALPIGEYVVMLNVSGPGGNAAVVHDLDVITACDAVEDVIAKVGEAPVTRKCKRPLVSTLKAACMSFERGDFAGGKNQLRGFIVKVRNEMMAQDPVAALAAMRCTQSILDALHCD